MTLATEVPVRPVRRPPIAGRFAGYGFVAPFLLLYLLFLVGPALYNLVAGFFNTSLVRPGLGAFVGVHNFAEALTSSAFWASVGHTLLFTVLTTVPLVVLGLALAVLADRVRRGRWFFRLAFFAPYVLTSSVISLIWLWILTDQIGLAQSILGLFGLGAPGWLDDPNWVLASIALATVWWTLGFNFVLYLAALQDIPREVTEAAVMDGAGPWQRITRITVPMLGRTTRLVLVLQIIASLKVFDQIYIITQGGGGPNYSARSAVEYVFDTGFTDYRVGYASAVAFLLLLLMMAVSAAWVRLIREGSTR